METKKYVLGFVAAMVAGAVVALTACADAPQRTEDRLAEVEKQLVEERVNTALAEERLEDTNRQQLEALLAQEDAVLAKEGAERAATAAYERVRAQYKCNMKIAAVWNVLVGLVTEYGFVDWDSWTDPSPAFLALLYENEEAVELMEKWWVDGDWGSISYADRHLHLQAIIEPMIDDLEDGDC